MGGDYGPVVCVPAALELSQKTPQLELILVGDQPTLQPMLGSASRVRVKHASQVVTMDESPVLALRTKKDSSMRVALDLVRAGEADACVSAGNTGALMATARFVLKTLPGIDRPAIVSAIPAIGGHTHMLDLGANAEATPEQLFQFAVMGSIVAHDVHELDDPRIGLLNIGEEDIKGTDTVRQAGELLSNSRLNYVGFVEGNDIFSGRVDVVVTDGFTGNIALKTMEGATRMVGKAIAEEFSRDPLSRARGLLARPVMRALKRRLDPRTHNGASMVGLNGIVIKSHGGADEVAFGNAVRTAVLEVEKGIPHQIGQLIERHFSQRQAV